MKLINQIIETQGGLYFMLGLGMLAGVAITMLYCYDYIVVSKFLKEENNELRSCLGRPLRKW